MSATGEATRPSDADRGATLLEMLVVLGILLLTTGIIFPNLRRPYDTLSAETARSAVSADLRDARAQAIRTGRPVEFDIAGDGRTYGYDGASVLLPAAARLAAEPASIVFAPDGSSSGAQLAVIQRGGRRFGFALDAPTGVVGLDPVR
jgi:type II secretory pathway pseudopilin PulG